MDRTKRWRINAPHVVAETIDGETVMIHLETGSYYSTNRSGAAIWEALAAGLCVPEIAARLGAIHGTLEAIETSVARFATELAAETLIVPADVRAGAVWDPAVGLSFADPALEKFDDMRDLLLADPIHDVDESGWPPRPESARRD